MSPTARLITAVAIVCALLVAVSLYLKSWGGVALVVMAAAGFAWYRIQVMRGEEAAKQFFADAGEETRLTSFQGTTGFQHASPSEMPADRPPAAPPATTAPPAGPR
ncbi:hypothetical protein [Ramlibacter sp.]|jgi:hypothetical protein|uniref:hypothetical protein n=1 Tax=Ramlibacter sp. TaxID=1917967 RepID=UPI002FC7A69B|nr:hypothetical protein [Ramlibacter sp.]MCE3269801.1 hypothetical protein [Ramlibacter sp.]